MQQCMHYHRTHHHDPSWLPPGRVLEMCTIDAARALGMDREIGSLEVGKKADVILVDLARPHMYPANMPLFRVTYFANGNDVATVIVDGKSPDARPGRAVGQRGRACWPKPRPKPKQCWTAPGFRSMLETPASFWGQVRAMDQVRSLSRCLHALGRLRASRARHRWWCAGGIRRRSSPRSRRHRGLRTGCRSRPRPHRVPRGSARPRSGCGESVGQGGLDHRPRIALRATDVIGIRHESSGSAHQPVRQSGTRLRSPHSRPDSPPDRSGSSARSAG